MLKISLNNFGVIFALLKAFINSYGVRVFRSSYRLFPGFGFWKGHGLASFSKHIALTIQW